MKTISSLIKRTTALWAELDSAQQRLFELQTGIPLTGRRRKR